MPFREEAGLLEIVFIYTSPGIPGTFGLSRWRTVHGGRGRGPHQRARADGLELIGGEDPRRYSVAWLDMLAEGPSMGRAIVSRADPLAPGETPPAPRRGRGRPESYSEQLTRPAVLGVPQGTLQVFPG